MCHFYTLPLRQNNTDMDNQYTYKYPHPAVTADCVIFGFDGSSLKVLLVERGVEPYKGYWALPGGFMRIDETIEQAAARELREETNLSNIFIEQFKVYSDPSRDPRERVITVAFIALVRPADYKVVAGDDAAAAMWFDESMLPPLAFDHHSIIRDAREHLCEVLRIRPVAFELLNKYFSLGELQKVYEVINRTEYDRRNFQRSVLDADIITEAPSASYRPAASAGRRPSKIYTMKDDDCLENNAMSEKAIMCNMNYDNSAILCQSEDIEPSGNTSSRTSEGSTKGLFDFLRRK